jgi:hypothetical protein
LSYLADSRTDGYPVRPGEQWFFYWKTSAALWETRILETAAHEILFIPVNWGFHAESPTQWDFGQIQPEKDLYRLVQILMQHGRKFCWLIPLTPAPFLPNGGVPVHAARTLSLSSDGVHLAVMDHEEKLNKMFSFYEPKVFTSFSSFLKAFGQFIAKSLVKAPMWGVSFSYQEGTSTHSYFTDTSIAFEQGFNRYLKQNFPEGASIEEARSESKLKESFTSEVKNLFKATAESALGPYWSGAQDIVVLGGSPRETIERGLTEGKTQFKFFKDLFGIYTHNQWMSSCLLTKKEKSQLLPKFLDEHFGSSMIEERFKYQQHHDLDQTLRPFGLVDIFGHHSIDHFGKAGLLAYLDESYRWMYQVHEELNFSVEWIEAHQQTIKIFSGAHLTRTQFSQMLKLFLMGQKVVLDKTGLHPDLDKRLQIFYLENNLKSQSVNFVTSINICELGDGKFVTVDGTTLAAREDHQKFWGQLFKFLNLLQPEVHLDDDVFSLWRIRDTTSADLNYLDVRRVNLYNPTSYKKRVTIFTKKHFAYMKSIDPVKAEAKSTSDGVEVEILPFGKIALDFGHYEEN